MSEARLAADLVVARELQLLLQVRFSPCGGELLSALKAGVSQTHAAQLYPYAYADLAPGLLTALREPTRGWSVHSVLNSNGHRRPEELYQSAIYPELQRQEDHWCEHGYAQQVAALLPEYVRFQPLQNEDAIKDELEGLLWDVFDALNFLQWVAHMHAGSRRGYLKKVARACVELGLTLPVALESQPLDEI